MLARSLAIALAAAAVAAGSAAGASVCGTGCVAAPAGSGALFLFSGHGWGHGVGLSQYGAYGYAQHGATYQQILAHYYPGTTLGATPVSTIRVLLADKKKTLKLSSQAAFTIRDAAGVTVTAPAGTLAVTPKLAVRGKALQPPLTVTPGPGAPLVLTRAYRGRITLDVVDGKLRAVNVVPLEQYLDGVVPSEMPSSWSAEALKAQAVAARSYAIATRQLGAPFDVFNDTRSQMYLGIDHESPATTAAVNATKKQVVLYNGAVATTYFSSTSGGRTESALNWMGKAVPYLVSVPDPYDDLSPYHNWGPTPVTAQAIVKALKLTRPVTDVTGPVTDATAKLNTSGRAATLSLLTPLEPVTVPATTLRSALGLRSTWFTVGVMSLSAPAPNVPVTYGASVTLGGAVRGVSGVTLEQKPLGGQWQPMSTIGTGAVHASPKPVLTTDYRLATTTAAAGSVRIRVAPAISLSTFDTTLVAGSVQPVLMGATAQVEQQNPGGTWTAVASAVLDAGGSFSIPVSLVSGTTYRVTVGATAGFAAGSTTPQIVVR
jgi:stage II sporulation protein D